jgi:hypothetical protein
VEPIIKDGEIHEVQAVVDQWLVAFQKKNPKALTVLTTTPAVIDGQLAKDAGFIFKLYSALLEQDRANTTRLATARPGRPVMARLRDVRANFPRETKELSLADGDHAVNVTVEESGLKFVLFIRQGSPTKISGVTR